MYWLSIIFISSLFEFFNDLNLIVKIFAAMMLISWIKNHVGTGMLGIVLMVAIGFFVLFDGWALFGPIYVLYMLLMFGLSGVLIDFFFISQGGPPQINDIDSPISHGIDVREKRMQHIQHKPHGILRR